MFVVFYSGNKETGFGYQGQLNCGINLLTIRPENRDYWLSVYDLNGKIEVKKIKNHEVSDCGDIPKLV